MVLQACDRARDVSLWEAFREQRPAEFFLTVRAPGEQAIRVVEGGRGGSATGGHSPVAFRYDENSPRLIRANNWRVCSSS